MSLLSLKENIARELQDVDVLKELTRSQFMTLAELCFPEKVKEAQAKVLNVLSTQYDADPGVPPN